MATIESIQKAYVDFVSIQGRQPASVHLFANDMNIPGNEFYRFFDSFDEIEQSIWTDFALKTIAEIKKQRVWFQFTAREKALSFFYTFFEHLKVSRRFVVYMINKIHRAFGTPQIFAGMRRIFEQFCNDLVSEGVKSNELSDRKFFTNRYKDALWVQLVFVLNFWINDNSKGFEKTNEAIERGIDVTFDLFQRSPIDNLFEFSRFITFSRGLKPKMSFGNN